MASRRGRADIQIVFDAVRRWVQDHYGCPADEIAIRLLGGKKVRLPLPPPRAGPDDETVEEEQFIPSAFQLAILAALEGKAMRSDSLGAEVRDRSRLFRHPGGIKELQEQGLVAHHKRLGYFRPDCPPEQLEAGSD